MMLVWSSDDVHVSRYTERGMGYANVRYKSRPVHIFVQNVFVGVTDIHKT